MKKIFLDIDTQFDFMNPNGSLYVEDAGIIIQNLKRLTVFAVNNRIVLISTLDTHTANDPEFKDFPPHCILNTQGHKKIDETMTANTVIIHYEDIEQVLRLNYNNWRFLKPGYDAFSNPLFEKFIERYKDHEFIVYGVATDYCIKATALGLLSRGYKVTIIEDAVKGVSEDTTLEALNQLKDNGASFTKAMTILK